MRAFSLLGSGEFSGFWGLIELILIIIINTNKYKKDYANVCRAKPPRSGEVEVLEVGR